MDDLVGVVFIALLHKELAGDSTHCRYNPGVGYPPWRSWAVGYVEFSKLSKASRSPGNLFAV